MRWHVNLIIPSLLLQQRVSAFTQTAGLLKATPCVTLTCSLLH